MSDLTILCVTQNRPHAQPFIDAMGDAALILGARFVIAVDGRQTGSSVWTCRNASVWFMKSQGYLESILEQAIGSCPDGYILRLDDDERMSPAMVDWLAAGEYRTADHWAFPRANLWPDAGHRIVNVPLWPDLQTRLSVKAKAGGRTQVHAGSPHGTGRVAAVHIEHHKFLVRDQAERTALVEHYERLQPGAGRDFTMFSLPELYTDEIRTEAIT